MENLYIYDKDKNSVRKGYDMKTTKSIGMLVLIFSVLLSSTIVYADTLPFELNSKSAILMDFNSGEVLFENKADEKLPMASITKIMTVLLTLEAIDEGRISLEQEVNVSEYAASMGGSQVFLAPGESFDVSTMLKAIIVASANDASVAMAEKIAGSHEAFVKLMNRKASQLEMNNTNFVNCTGLPAENHYSSARDIAIMSRKLIKHKEFFNYSTIWLDYMRDGETMLVNTNKLVRFYDGCDGIKTGFTSDSMYCLSATAKRGETRLLSVVLGSPTSPKRFSDVKKLFDHGFANYESKKLVKENQLVRADMGVTGGKLPYISGLAGEDFFVLAEKGEKLDYDSIVELPEVIKAPIKKGQVLGKVKIIQGQKLVGEVDIISDKEVEIANYYDYISKIFNKWIKK